MATMVATRVEAHDAALGARATAYNAAVGLGFLAIAYAQVFILPTVAPVPGADSMIFLAGAARMVRGEAIYRDFFEITYPGTELYYAAWMKVVGVKAWIEALSLVLLGTTCALLTWRIALRALRNERAALQAGLATIAFPVSNANDATHRW